MRVRKKPWAAAELAENPRIVRSAAQKELAAVFDARQPLHVEVGCGKGRFITETANRYPKINHLAIERDPTILAAAARLAGAMPDFGGALFFLELDVAQLSEYFNPGEIDRLYINFCDPWMRKKKWAKRCLTHANFLAVYEALRIPEIFFKTDNRLLFEFSLNQFSERGWIMRNISLDLHKAPPTDNVMTEYEEKFSAHGPIYRLEAYRKP